MTPNFPSPYKQKEICHWMLIAECNETISLHFQEFETELLHDYVEIIEYDSEQIAPGYRPGTKDKMHGWIYPEVYESTYNALQIEFVADCNVHYKGFKIYYTSKPKGNTKDIVI